MSKATYCWEASPSSKPIQVGFDFYHPPVQAVYTAWTALMEGHDLAVPPLGEFGPHGYPSPPKSGPPMAEAIQVISPQRPALGEVARPKWKRFGAELRQGLGMGCLVQGKDGHGISSGKCVKKINTLGHVGTGRSTSRIGWRMRLRLWSTAMFNILCKIRCTGWAGHIRMVLAEKTSKDI